MTAKNPNRLFREKSPYLLQHAFNPVDWYPWGEEAFAKARDERKPIFLSVGYSTCHWCHVMEHESFENDSIAAIMNEHFVAIKVDREERPDVDRVYMTALQAMGQDGGWPMSMFLTPELKPFWGGTYFPPESRYGRAGFADILKRIHELWLNERGNISESAEQITAYLREIPAAAAGAEDSGALLASGPALLDRAFEQLERTFDERSGGFGRAPKFPRPVTFGFLLRIYARTGNGHALEMALTTLRRMAEGGIHDHIGGGFHRYSVDGEWRVPHFEKMAYDQAQLAHAYLDVYAVSGNQIFESVARDILDYVLRDMTSQGGGFYSAEDADSARPDTPGEQGEGAFYVWTKKEVADALGDPAARIFCFCFGVEEGGNAPFDPQNEFTGRNILYQAHTVDEAAQAFSRPPVEIRRILTESRKRLLEIRAHRPRPHRDDKILTSWNGMMISACARGYQVLGETEYLEAAVSAADFILRHRASDGSGRLYRRYRDGEASIEGKLDDYAAFACGLLDLYESTFEIRWLRMAIDLTEVQLRLFRDEAHGGFYETAGGDATILVRMKEMYDGAEPSGNSLTAMNLLRLAEMTGRSDFRNEALRVFSAFRRQVEQQPLAMPALLAAFDFASGNPFEIVITAEGKDPVRRSMLREVHSRYLPNRVILCTGDAEELKSLAEIAPYVSVMSAIGGKTTAYVCRNHVCDLPATDAEALSDRLRS